MFLIFRNLFIFKIIVVKLILMNCLGVDIMKRIIPLVLVGILLTGTAVNASAKAIEKKSPTVAIMRCMTTDPDDPRPK